MKMRLLSCGHLLLAATFLPATCFAQAAEKDSMAELKSQIAQLQKAVEDLAAVTVTKTDLDQFVSKSEFQDRASRVDSKIDAIVQTASDQSAQIGQLREELQKVTDSLAKQVGDQERILAAISQPTADGSRVLALRSNMQRDPAFREEVQQAVNDSIRRSGTLEVQNNMAIGKYFKVNGREWYIAAGATREFQVPVGTLTTELVGDEPRRTFTIGPPNYRETIEINPRRQVLSQPVVETLYEPIVTETPSYVYPVAPVVVWGY